MQRWTVRGRATPAPYGRGATASCRGRRRSGGREPPRDARWTAALAARAGGRRCASGEPARPTRPAGPGRRHAGGHDRRHDATRFHVRVTAASSRRCPSRGVHCSTLPSGRAVAVAADDVARQAGVEREGEHLIRLLSRGRRQRGRVDPGREPEGAGEPGVAEAVHPAGQVDLAGQDGVVAARTPWPLLQRDTGTDARSPAGPLPARSATRALASAGVAKAWLARHDRRRPGPGRGPGDGPAGGHQVGVLQLGRQRRPARRSPPGRTGPGSRTPSPRPVREAA